MAAPSAWDAGYPQSGLDYNADGSLFWRRNLKDTDLPILPSCSTIIAASQPIQVQFSSPSADLFDLEPPSGFVSGIAETDW